MPSQPGSMWDKQKPQKTQITKNQKHHYQLRMHLNRLSNCTTINKTDARSSRTANKNRHRTLYKDCTGYIEIEDLPRHPQHAGPYHLLIFSHLFSTKMRNPLSNKPYRKQSHICIPSFFSQISALPPVINNPPPSPSTAARSHPTIPIQLLNRSYVPFVNPSTGEFAPEIFLGALSVSGNG